MKTFVVTGATSGIGRATVFALLKAGANVYGVGRDPSKIDQLVTDTKTAHYSGTLFPVLGQLETTTGVLAIADRIKSLTPVLTGIIHVAGTVSTWHRLTDEGFELQFSVNHLAPFALTHHLLPLLTTQPDAKILVVSSRSHRFGTINFDDLMMTRRYSNLSAYARTKLMNNLFVAEFTRRSPQFGVSAYAFDPGLVNTEIGQKNTKGIEALIWRMRRRGGVDPSIPAGWLVHHALQSNDFMTNGSYLKEGRAILPSRSSLREDWAKRLWETSEKLIGITSYFHQKKDSN